MIFVDVEQNTEEWLELRRGKITGSAIGKIMANEGKAFGDPAKAYALQIALERITGESAGGGYSNAHMERGHEQEPLARMLYEETYFCDVTNGGFFDLGGIGCSPDGMVGEDGLIEIKSVIASVHYANVKRGGVDPSYKWQVISNLLFTEREWIDFVSYCHEYPVGKKLFVHRTFKKDCGELFDRLSFRMGEFNRLIDETTSAVMA